MGKRGHHTLGLVVDVKNLNASETREALDERIGEASRLQELGEGYQRDLDILNSAIEQIKRKNHLNRDEKRQIIRELEAKKDLIEEEAQEEVTEQMEGNTKVINELKESADLSLEDHQDFLSSFDGITDTASTDAVDTRREVEREADDLLRARDAATRELQNKIEMTNRMRRELRNRRLHGRSS